MEAPQELTVKIDYLQSKIDAIQTKIIQRDVSLAELITAKWKAEVDVEIARTLYKPGTELAKLLNQKDDIETKIKNLNIISFKEEKEEIDQLTAILNTYKTQRDGANYEEFEES